MGLHGLDFSIVSILGIVALAGVAVNDSLVLVEFIGQYRARGGTLIDAVRNVGAARSGAIILTSVTTFVGLPPLIFERSLQAVFQIPMAISPAYGVMFTTLVSLILVPCLYLILEDLGDRARAIRAALGGGFRHAKRWQETSGRTPPSRVHGE